MHTLLIKGEEHCSTRCAYLCKLRLIAVFGTFTLCFHRLPLDVQRSRREEASIE